MNSNWSYSRETPNLGQIRRFLEPCDLEIWRMTLKNNRAPLLCHFKLCASFRSHWWIQTGVTIRKHPIWVKFDSTLSDSHFTEHLSKSRVHMVLVSEQENVCCPNYQNTSLTDSLGPQMRLPDGHFGQFRAIGPMELLKPVTDAYKRLSALKS